MLPSAHPSRPQHLAVAVSAHPTPLPTKPSSLQRPPSIPENSTQRLGLPLALAMRLSPHQAASTPRRWRGSDRLLRAAPAPPLRLLLISWATIRRLDCSRVEHQHPCHDMTRRRQALQRRGCLLSGQALVVHKLALQARAPNRTGWQQGPVGPQRLVVSFASYVCEFVLSAHM